jgi:hypothetical protein
MYMRSSVESFFGTLLTIRHRLPPYLLIGFLPVLIPLSEATPNTITGRVQHIRCIKLQLTKTID